MKRELFEPYSIFHWKLYYLGVIIELAHSGLPFVSVALPVRCRCQCRVSGDDDGRFLRAESYNDHINVTNKCDGWTHSFTAVFNTAFASSLSAQGQRLASSCDSRLRTVPWQL